MLAEVFSAINAVFSLRNGQVQNCPNWFGEAQICPKHLSKLAQICKNCAQMCQRVGLNSQKPCSNADEILPQHYITLPICCQDNAQTLLTLRQVYIRGEFKQSLYKRVFV